jgi:SSS family solute:Na+ symporter
LVTVGLVALAGTAQVIVPTMGALFWKRSTVAGAIASTLTGIGLLTLFTFGVLTPPGPFVSGGAGLFALMVNIVVFFAVSLMTKPRPEKLMNELKQQYSDFYHGVNM